MCHDVCAVSGGCGSAGDFSGSRYDRKEPDGIPIECLYAKSSGAGAVYRGSAWCDAGIFPGNGNYGANRYFPGIGTDHQCDSQYCGSEHFNQGGNGSSQKEGQSAFGTRVRSGRGNAWNGNGSFGCAVIFDICVCVVPKGYGAADAKRPDQTQRRIPTDFKSPAFNNRSDFVQYGNLQYQPDH